MQKRLLLTAHFFLLFAVYSISKYIKSLWSVVFSLLPNPRREITPRRLFTSAYELYSQLHLIPEGPLLHPKPKDTPFRCDRDTLNIASFYFYLPKMK
jgi:hypothetical protein